MIVTTQATALIVELASATFTFKKAKDRRAASESILVAVDSVISKRPLVISTSLPWLRSGQNDCQSLLPPKNHEHSESYPVVMIGN